MAIRPFWSVFLAVVMLAGPAFADTVSATPGTIGTLNVSGDAWVSASDADVSNDTRAVCTTTDGANSTDLLLFSSFDFSGIPADAVVDGVVISIEARYGGLATNPIFAAGATTDATIDLLSPSDHLPFFGDANLVVSVTDSVYSLGTPTDAWSWGTNATALTRADLVSPEMTFIIAGRDLFLSGIGVYEVDDVQVTVHYSVPTLGNRHLAWWVAIALMCVAWWRLRRAKKSVV